MSARVFSTLWEIVVTEILEGLVDENSENIRIYIICFVLAQIAQTYKGDLFCPLEAGLTTWKEKELWVDFYLLTF